VKDLFLPPFSLFSFKEFPSYSVLHQSAHSFTPLSVSHTLTRVAKSEKFKKAIFGTSKKAQFQSKFDKITYHLSSTLQKVKTQMTNAFHLYSKQFYKGQSWLVDF
jgi:hypothetical protein